MTYYTFIGQCPFCDYKDEGVIVYKDDECFAVISADPINKYHVLVIPKKHYEQFVDLPDALASHIFLVAKEISRVVRGVCNADAISHVSDDDVSKSGYNLVKHYKFHIIPRFKENIDTVNWEALRTQADEKTRAQYAEEIKRRLVSYQTLNV